MVLLLPASASKQLPTFQQPYLCYCHHLLCPARGRQLLLPAVPWELIRGQGCKDLPQP